MTDIEIVMIAVQCVLLAFACLAWSEWQYYRHRCNCLHELLLIAYRKSNERIRELEEDDD